MVCKLFTYSNLITHTHSHSPLPPPHTQRVTQIAVVLLIVIGLFMFTYHSTTFDLEGFILVRMSPSHWLEGEVDCVHHVHHTRGGRVGGGGEELCTSCTPHERGEKKDSCWSHFSRKSRVLSKCSNIHVTPLSFPTSTLNLLPLSYPSSLLLFPPSSFPAARCHLHTYTHAQVIVASVITGLRWSTAQLTLQKEELGMFCSTGEEQQALPCSHTSPSSVYVTHRSRRWLIMEAC